MKEQVIYIPTPISQKPEKDGRYMTMWHAVSEWVEKEFKDGEWQTRFDWTGLMTHWLRPTTLPQELAAKDKEIETLTRQVKAYKTLQKTGDEIRAHQSKLLSEAETVESEREANAILTDEIEKRDKEIAELKDTIDRMAVRLKEMAQDAIKAQGHN